MAIETRVTISSISAGKLGQLAARLGWTERRTLDVAIQLAANTDLNTLISLRKVLLRPPRKSPNGTTEA